MEIRLILTKEIGLMLTVKIRLMLVTRHDDDPHLTIRGGRYMAIHGNPAPVPTL